MSAWAAAATYAAVLDRDSVASRTLFPNSEAVIGHCKVQGATAYMLHMEGTTARVCVCNPAPDMETLLAADVPFKVDELSI